MSGVPRSTRAARRTSLLAAVAAVAAVAAGPLLLDLADSRGEVAVADVWGSGCSPCSSETSMLVEAAGGLGATVVGNSTRDYGVGTDEAFEREVG